MPPPTPDAVRTAQLERSAVNLSLWVGGVGLAAAKGVAYLATGSVLVRASMFDSLGDVFSSLIMALTQWKVNDHRDNHRYPMGKGRFAPLGVLFFCAFMCSTMLSMALDSVQSLFAGSQEDGQGEAALRWLLTEKPRLRWAYGPMQVEALSPSHMDDLIAEYGTVTGDDGSIDKLSIVLLAVCVATKIVLCVWCRYVGARRSSEIVAALADDHRNDTISNSMVIATMVTIATLTGSSLDGPWVAKVDPGISFFLSLWIVYGWITKALEQFGVLSDQRVEDVDLEAINQAAQGALSGTAVQFQGTEVYHVGSGYRVQLRVRPGQADTESVHMATLFQTVEGAVRGASPEVQQVDVHLRPEGDSFAWVKEYAK